VVAALGDAQVGCVRRGELEPVVLWPERHRRGADEHARPLRRRVEAWLGVVGVGRRQRGEDVARDVGVRLKPDDGVHLWQLVRQLLGVALRHAPRHVEAAHARAAVRLEPRRVDDRGDRLALCILDKGAGIDDDDVSILRLAHHPQPVPL